MAGTKLSENHVDFVAENLLTVLDFVQRLHQGYAPAGIEGIQYAAFKAWRAQTVEFLKAIGADHETVETAALQQVSASGFYGTY